METLQAYPEYLAPITRVLRFQAGNTLLGGSPTGENYNDPGTYDGFGTMLFDEIL